MTDPFELFGIVPALRLEDKELQSIYDERCREHHPDQGGDAESFSVLQEAYAVLRDPGRRLRAWEEQHGGQVGAVTDEDTLEVITRVGD